MSGSVEESLVGLRLDGYMVEKMAEVYKTDVDGMKTNTVGYFRNGQVAAAWAQGQTDPFNHKTAEVLVVTNGERHFSFGGQPISLFDDEQAALEVREKALAKLSPEERAVLGL